jgi:hypothetical protein
MQSQAQYHTKKGDAEILIKYNVTALVRFQQLHIQPNEGQISNGKGYTYGDAKADSNLRFEVRNHIPAIVQQRQLDAAIRAPGVSAEQLVTCRVNYPQRTVYPELVFPEEYQLNCVKG